VHFVDKGASKRAGRHAGHAFYAPPHIKFYGSGLFVSSEGIKKTGFDAGRIIALQTGDRHIFIFGMSQGINSAPSLF
jgi:hypothetical protein